MKETAQVIKNQWKSNDLKGNSFQAFRSAKSQHSMESSVVFSRKRL